jgi:hypothetical protein
MLLTKITKELPSLSREEKSHRRGNQEGRESRGENQQVPLLCAPDDNS